MGLHDGHRQRMKERFARHGLDSFAEHEVLERVQQTLVQEGWDQDYELIFSGKTLLEMTAKGANKGGMVRRLAELLGIRQENVACVGDHANDISMLNWAGMAFAPANALPQVLALPQVYKLPDCRDNAIAALIQVLDEKY